MTSVKDITLNLHKRLLPPIPQLSINAHHHNSDRVLQSLVALLSLFPRIPLVLFTMGRKKNQSGSSKKKRSKNKANNQAQQMEASPSEKDETTVASACAIRNNSKDDNHKQADPTSTTSNMRRPSKLESLPPHLLFKIVNHLDQRERDILFHLVTGNNDTEDSSDDDEQEEETNGTEQEQEHHPLENNKQQESPVHPNQPQQEQQRWRVPFEFVTADPDTLLARLNTRRLRKRLQDKSDYTYPHNMTTDEIALLEWNNTLTRATQQGRLPEDQLPPLISPSRELLMFTPCPRSVAVLASYPRSGNSLMRTLYEKITQRVSGSDMRGGLASHDLVGEAAVSSRRVQFVKTHYPERRGIQPYTASRVVLLVRNPYDALDSFFHLMTTGTHTTSLRDEWRDKLTAVWESMVKKEICVWQAFYEFWLSQEIPLLLVRYEDLIRFPYQVMCRVIQFVLEVSFDYLVSCLYTEIIHYTIIHFYYCH